MSADFSPPRRHARFGWQSFGYNVLAVDGGEVFGSLLIHRRFFLERLSLSCGRIPSSVLDGGEENRVRER